MMVVEAEQDLLQIAPPMVDAADAAAIATNFYGFSARAKQLSGERDLNFLLTDDIGTRRILKIANAGEKAEILDFQHSALDHLARSDCAHLVPKVIRSEAQAALVQIEDRSGRPHLASMLSYIDGIPLAGSAADITPSDCRQIGTLLARLDVGLAGFRHPAQQRQLLWDLSLAAGLRPKLGSIADPGLLNLANEALDRFEAEALPALASLPRQVIHNDLNPHNLILTGPDVSAIAGIIDFGDMLEAPRANDVAVAASYHFQRGLQAPAALIAGYHGVLPMTDQELALVPLLIAARSVLTVAIASWRAALYPENSAYIQRNLPAAARTLAALSGDGRRRLEDQIAISCKQGS